jgi:leucyl aminopeptidase
MIIKLNPPQTDKSTVLFIDESEIEQFTSLDAAEQSWIKNKSKEGIKIIPFLIHSPAPIIVVPFAKTDKESSEQRLERIRTLGHLAFKMVTDFKIKDIQISAVGVKESYAFAFMEGLALSNYKFYKYKKKSDPNGLIANIQTDENSLSEKKLTQLNNLIQAVYFVRDLVNEPVGYLTAAQLTEKALAMAAECGIQTTTLSVEEMETLQMGGVLGVNKGSAAPPTFNILEWTPEKAVNKKPLVLVGKGVVYDTGGYSIKPSSGMETMKCDMAGGGAVFGAIYAAALDKLPLHIVAIVPAVENRVNEHAIVPGDIITISDGTTVEVMNTDAEGRLILADALVYAKKYNPALVMDFATLTGAAVRAIGSSGTVYMGTADHDTKKLVEKSGWKTYERMVEFPLWDEYADMLKSEIADISNVGGALAGASTAGKFLQRFTDYPWLHFDIAGPAFLTTGSFYRTTGGTGTGVRFLVDFFKRWMEECQDEKD